MTILPELATADTCPICRADHATLDDYQTCPHHHHLLQSGGRDDDGYLYYCPLAYTPTRCHYERHYRAPLARKEPPPMTTTPVTEPGSFLAVRTGQRYWTDSQLTALRQIGLDGAPDAELAVFFHRCQATGLDPFNRQICMVKRGSKWTVQTEIDGYRLIGHRAARRDGKTISKPGPIWYDADGNTYPAWFKPGPPAAAKVTILVDGQPFEGVASYAEFVQLQGPFLKNGKPNPKAGQPTEIWEKMGANQTAKCAEAQAWRAAFPADFRLQGVEFTADPMPTAEPTAAAETWHAAAQPLEADRDHVAHAKAAEALTQQWERLGVTDPDEQLNLTGALAGYSNEIAYPEDELLDDLRSISASDIGRLTKQLAKCEDVGQVHALIDRGDKPGATDG